MAISLVDRLLKLAIDIQQIPAPTFNEAARSTFVRDRFWDEGLSDVTVDPLGNVFARIPGRGKAPSLVVSAHLDTVFPTNVDLKVVESGKRIKGPGIGDNAVGVAGLFGLLWQLRLCKKVEVISQINKGEYEIIKPLRSTLPGDLWLVANVGEEGLGDLFGMRAVVERFGSEPRAYISLEGLALGQIYHQGLGVQRYRISTRTPGGHSWVDHGQPSAIHELAELVTRLAALPLPSHPRTSLNVGIISGGTSINTIASEAYLDLDLRSEDKQALTNLIREVERLVAESNSGKVKTSLEVVGNRPAGEIHHRHPLVLMAMRALKEAGVEPCLNVGSTDANVPLSQGLPAICIGITTGGGAHTLEEYINTPPVLQGLEQLFQLVQIVFEEN